MPGESFKISNDVYESLLELQSRLRDEYGEDINLSDTIDFLGHRCFLFDGLLDIAESWMKITSDSVKRKPGLMDKLLGAVGARMPGDNTCFVRSNVEMPSRWAGTRWLKDVHGKNILKCFYEGDEGERGAGRKINIR